MIMDLSSLLLYIFLYSFIFADVLITKKLWFLHQHVFRQFNGKKKRHHIRNIYIVHTLFNGENLKCVQLYSQMYVGGKRQQ